MFLKINKIGNNLKNIKNFNSSDISKNQKIKLMDYTGRPSKFQIAEGVTLGGLWSPEKCREVSRRVMQYYDSNNDGQIDSIEIGQMMSDVYRALNKDYRPSGTDIVQFSRIITRRDLARVTDKDITEICLKNHSSGKQEPVKRNKWVEERLDVARRLFKMIDSDASGFITEQEVPMLLVETYKQMGVEYRPNEEDVRSWMQMADTDRDGKVYLQDYEALVLRSLNNQGIKLD